jgi:hypothetical protein
MTTPNAREAANSRWYRNNINDALLGSNAGRQARTAAATTAVQRLAQLEEGADSQCALLASLSPLPSDPFQ